MASSSQTTIGYDTNYTTNSSNQSATSGCFSANIPDMKAYIANLSQAYVVTFCVLGAVTFVILVLFIEEAIRLHLPSQQRQSRRDKAKWLLAVYPVVAITSMVALVVPRTSSLNQLLYSMYISVCVHIFVSMLIDLCGGPAQMLYDLCKTRISLSVPPLCCCFVCLPTFTFTRTRLLILRVIAMQFAFVRPIVGYFQAIIWTNLLEALTASQYLAYKTVNRYLTIVYTVSALFAVWSFAMVIKMVRGPLSQYHVTPKFICFQSMLVISSVQPLLFDILVMVGVIRCEPGPLGLPAEAVASRYNNMVIIGEVLLLSIAARIIYFRAINGDVMNEQTTSRSTSSSEIYHQAYRNDDWSTISSRDSVVTLSVVGIQV